jgi:hypothetical protein
MSYCSIEEAWGQQFVKKHDPSQMEIGGVDNALYDSSLDDGIVFSDKYRLKNSHTRKIHNKRSRKQRVKKRNMDLGDLKVQSTSDFTYVDPQQEVVEYSDVPSAYSPSNNNLLRSVQMGDDNLTTRNLEDVPTLYESVAPQPQQPNHLTVFQEHQNNDLQNNSTSVEQEEDLGDEHNNNQNNSNGELNELKKELQKVLQRLGKLERDVKANNVGNIHDVILFVLMGVFILFILDSIFKIGRMTI